MIRKLWNKVEGQGMAEYALILALVSVVAIVALLVLGPEVQAVFEDVINSMRQR